MAIHLPILRTMKRLNADYVDRTALLYELETMRLAAARKHEGSALANNETSMQFWAGVNDGLLDAMQKVREC